MATTPSGFPIPTLQDILQARQIIYRYLPRTPLYASPALSRMLDAEVYIKHENHLPIGSFKVRGGINRLYYLTDQEKARGVITASTGNHGQSIAYAARVYGVEATILVPTGNNPDKNRAMENLGARVIAYGRDFDEAREYAEELVQKEGYLYVHPANEPLLIAGVGTAGLEIMEDLPDLEVLVNPIGGGSSASGNSIAIKTINPRVEVIGVQAEGAPAVFCSWKTGQLQSLDKLTTFAEGLATRVGFELPHCILQERLDDFILVSDEALKSAICILWEATHNLAEGAGAAATAGAFKIKDRLQGKKVCLIISGSNLTLDTLFQILQERTNSS